MSLLGSKLVPLCRLDWILWRPPPRVVTPPQVRHRRRAAQFRLCVQVLKTDLVIERRVIVGIARLVENTTRSEESHGTRQGHRGQYLEQTSLHSPPFSPGRSQMQARAIHQTCRRKPPLIPFAALVMKRFLFLTILCLAVLPTHAQRGDRRGQAQPEVWRDMNVPPAPILTPEVALKSFKLAPPFRIEIAAADPLLHDPVAMAIDAAGRMWVVEMRAYMPNVDGTGEDAKTGRVGVLEDTNGDGRMDKRIDFLTGLQMPRAIALVKDGILVAEPPNLLFCEDTDGDLKADKKTVILTGYARQGPVEHTDNGLMPGLDNWLYNAKSTKRIRQIDGKWVVQNTVFRGQWGITQDDYGRLYYNSNSAPLFGDLIPGIYTTRNPHYGTRNGIGLRLWGSSEVWTSRVNPGINRGYQKNMLRNGHLAVWTGASGPVIYRGDQYPASMIGDAFIPEPCGNMVRHQRITWKDGQPRGKNAYDKTEWLTSTDERFRPVNLYNGPDGCVYIVDLYRGILQHKHYVTTFLRKQIIERKLDQPIGLGRIYRIVHGPKPPHKPAQVKGDLVAHLESPNGWTRDTAQRLIVQSADAKLAPALRRTATSGKSHLGRQHALWALEGISQLDAETIKVALSDEHPRVRIAALRTLEAYMADPRKDSPETEAELVSALLPLRSDKNLDVRRQLALSLPAIPLPGSEPLLRDFVLANARDSIVRDGLITGLAGRELEFLQRTAAHPKWRGDDNGWRAIVRALAGCVARERSAPRIDRLLRLAAATTPHEHFQRALIDGLVSAALPNGRALKPVTFKSQPLAMAALAQSKNNAIQNQIKKLEKFVVWGEAAKPPPPPRALTNAESKRFETGKLLYQATCAACHHANGLGEEGKAPPLIDSPFLVGPADRAIGIVLHGVTGPITVHGRTYRMSMPALQGFNDEQIASILTYARREWEHRADPVTPADVMRVKQANANREAPWTEAELLKLK
ncbi:MAG: dehydrogenase [Verrucomicrobiales bacterium]|nr:dehydrogenase [Verrucomicrobiales bacterium]